MSMPSSVTSSDMAEGLRERRQSTKSNNTIQKSSWEDLPVVTNSNSVSASQVAQDQLQHEQEQPHQDDNAKNNKGQMQQLSQGQLPSDTNKPKKIHPPGYNKKRRDIVKLILVVVAASMLCGDPRVATVLSVVAMICLKEGKSFSVKNLKWLGLCILSFCMAVSSWSLERAVFSTSNNDNDNNTTKAERNPIQNILWGSAKVIQLCWGMTLSVFLFSAYMHGHKSLLEFEYKWDPPGEKPPSGPRTKDPPPKKYLLY